MSVKQSKHLKILKEIDGVKTNESTATTVNENYKKLKLSSASTKLNEDNQPLVNDFVNKTFTSQGKYYFVKCIIKFQFFISFNILILYYFLHI